MNEHARTAWDKAASTFDEAADPGLRDVEVHSAWVALMARVLPTPPSRIADLGCGTGTLTILAADLGHRVDGIDFSEQVLSIARAKAGTRTDVAFSTGDAAHPQLPVGKYHAVMCRHVLWALPRSSQSAAGLVEPSPARRSAGPH
ncbi:MAG: class I SAM-dependent methyltransferase [Nocardioidaceae bacterium]